MSAIEKLIRLAEDPITRVVAQAELAQLRGENEAIARKLDVAIAERDRLQLERDAAKSAKVSLQQQLDEARTELGEAINRHNALADSLAEARGEVERLNKHVEQITLGSFDGMQHLTKDSADLRQQLTQSEKAREAAVEALKCEQEARDELEGLVKVAACPNKCVDGVIIHMTDPDDQQQCQWCDVRTTLLARIEGRNTK